MAEGSPLLVANAPLSWTPRLAALAAAAVPLLAADGGADHLARLGLRPAAVIGDLDSISPETRAWLGEALLIERPDQDRTDLDKALEYAFDDLGVDRLTVLAAVGGRLDHDLGNLGLLARLAMGEKLIFEDAGHRILAVAGEAELVAQPGETWSFWTYDPSVRVTVDGVRWPIEEATIDAGGGPSISNEATADEVRVQASGGAVVVMRHFAR
jgi:thiamine pyrophosphokinase